MPPNRRSEDKVNVNAWVSRELKERFQAIARARGITLSQLLTELVEQQVENTNPHQISDDGDQRSED